MLIRKGKHSDIEQVMRIISDAQQFLREQGVDQWQDGYPTREIIEADIEQGYSFVVEDESAMPIAVAAISPDGEPTYLTIRDGAWPNDEPYVVIHRMAVCARMRGCGVAKMIFRAAEQFARAHQIRNIRVDTHADNRTMQRLLGRLGFVRCGEITLSSGASRTAYIKILD